MRTEKIRGYKAIFSLAYIYITMPFVIFICGYLKPIISIFILPIILVSIYKIIRDTPNLEILQFNQRTIIKIIVIVILISIWVYYSGIGNLVWQNKDHFWRNGIYEALVNESWPIGQAYITPEGESTRMLVYYIGFWLPSAVVGKCFGVEAGYKFQVFWAILGIFLLYMLISIWRKKVSVWPLLIFIFFSGLDILYLPLLGNKVPIFSNQFLDMPIQNYTYTSMTVNLFHVFNQAIPAWLATILLLLQKNHKSLIFILATVMLSATFPFIGLIPFTVFLVFHTYKEVGKSQKIAIQIGKFLKSVMTFQNVFGAGSIGLISFLYLKLNASSEIIKPLISAEGEQKVHAVVNVVPALATFLETTRKITGNPIFIYVCFIMFEIGIYLILVYRQQKNNGLFYVVLISLLVIPFIQIGEGTDFCMRVSIPAIFIIYLFVINFLVDNENRTLKYLMILLLLIASVNGFHEFARTIGGNKRGENAVIRIEALCQEGNFSGGNENFFFQKLSKPLQLKILSNMLIEYCTPEADEFLVTGAEFSKEQNSLVAKELIVDFNRKADTDIIFEDGGMLDDNSVFYQLELNGHILGVLDIDAKRVVIPQEYFNNYAQRLRITINREVKLYSSDNFKLYSIGG